MSELLKIEEKIKRKLSLQEYSGEDRIIHAKEAWDEIQELRAGKPPFIAKTDIPSLDSCIGGFRKGQLVILSGPPKNGKTAMCATFSHNFAKNGIKSTWIEYELTVDEFIEKYPGTIGEIDFYMPRQMPTGNMDWIENRIVESKYKFGVDVIFIDHLDFLRDPKDLRRGAINGMNMTAYIGAIVQQLKTIARDEELIIFLMTHLTKGKWSSRELPTSDDLSDSRQIAQLADIVMMMMRHREDKTSENIYSNYSTLAVIENRHNGQTKKIQVELKDKKFLEVDTIYENTHETSWKH